MTLTTISASKFILVSHSLGLIDPYKMSVRNGKMYLVF